MIRKFLNRFPPAQVYRWFEIIPGALVWSTLMAAIALSIWWPLAAVYVIILFDLYWLLRVGYLVIWLLISWKKFQQALKIDWLAKMEEQKDWNKIWHLVVLPTYQEPLAVIQNTLRAFTKVKYPLDKFIFVLAGEARAGEHFTQVAEAIKQEFGPQFGHFLVTVHPANIVGEMAGKGANGHWAGRRAQELIDSLGIPYEDVIVSNFDSDSCPHPQYFACLTYTFLTSPDPQHSSYQPVALYTNNMWESPAVTRVVAYSTTFWLLTDLARPERLFTFSSHSMPFRALVDVGFWQNDIVTEDSRIFLQCFVRYNGNYRVTPIYVPITMDTVYSGSLWNTLKNQYKQQRRWAYGVENFPYMAWHFWRSQTIPFAKKFRY
ncbi:MAG: glycosyltransferase family 2 protein, partial [Patescibacteria group bacterium]